MAKILRPRRGLHTYATSQNITLSKGEIFFSYSNDNYEYGMDTLIPSVNRIYIGDGIKSINSTTNSLQPFISNIMDDKVLNFLYPVGHLFITASADRPRLIDITTSQWDWEWELLPDNYVLKTITSGNSTTVSASNTGSTTLTAAQSGLPAHNHTASGGAVTNAAAFNTNNSATLSITTTDSGTHSHTYNRTYNGQSLKVGTGSSFTNYHTNANATVSGAGGHTHTATVPAHAHTVPAHGHGFTQPTISNATTQNASQGHTHTAGMPQNIGVYVWKRTA